MAGGWLWHEGDAVRQEGSAVRLLPIDKRASELPRTYERLAAMPTKHDRDRAVQRCAGCGVWKYELYPCHVCAKGY